MSKKTITTLKYVHRRCEQLGEELNKEQFKAFTQTRKSQPEIESMLEQQTVHEEIYSLKLIKSLKHAESCAILVNGALFSERDSSGRTTTQDLEKVANQAASTYAATSEFNKKLMATTLFSPENTRNIIKNGATIRGSVSHESYAEMLLHDMKILADEFEVFMKWEWPALEYDMMQVLLELLGPKIAPKLSPLYFNDKKVMPDDESFPQHLIMYKYRTGLASHEELSLLIAQLASGEEAPEPIAAMPHYFKDHPHYSVLTQKAKWLLEAASRLLIFADKLRHYRQLEQMDTPSLLKKILASFLQILSGVISVFGGAAVVASFGLSLAGSAAVNALLGYGISKLQANNNKTLKDVLEIIPSIFIVINNYVTARFTPQALGLSPDLGDYKEALDLTAARAVKQKIKSSISSIKAQDQAKAVTGLLEAIQKPDVREIITTAILATASDAKTPAKLVFDQKQQQLF